MGNIKTHNHHGDLIVHQKSAVARVPSSGTTTDVPSNPYHAKTTRQMGDVWKGSAGAHGSKMNLNSMTHPHGAAGQYLKGKPHSHAGHVIHRRQASAGLRTPSGRVLQGGRYTNWMQGVTGRQSGWLRSLTSQSTAGSFPPLNSVAITRYRNRQ